MTPDQAMRSKERPDEQRLSRMSDADITRQIAEDPDTMEFTDEMFAKATWVEPVPKHLLSLRIDRDVVEWFRATGKNYQSRMNAVLRAYMEHHLERQSQRRSRTRK